MYNGSHNGLSTLVLIGHLLQNLHIGEARVFGAYRIERVTYNPSYRQSAGADVVALIRHDDGCPPVPVWQVRSRDLHKPGPLTTAARALHALGCDPITARRDRAIQDPIDQPVPALTSLNIEEV